jgi:hypothetical protein
MKRLTFIAATLLLLESLPAPSSAQSQATFRQWAQETQSRIETDFRVPGSNLYYETTARNAFAFAWPQGVQLHAMVASGNTAQAQAMADEFHTRYWCFFNNRWGHNAVAGGCGDRYYDDNAWIAKALMELHALNGNATNLSRAREIIAFSMSGENPTNVSPGGGIKFHEGDTSGQCLCATAPTMTTNLMIYRATGIAQYLTDGQRLYNWVKANRFGLGPGYRGYENAVITQAAILLYRITGNTVYLDDARHIGLAMETTYVNWANHALRETGQWGGHDMTAAYVDLYQLDGDINWLNIVAGYLSYLRNNLRDANGRYPETWDSAPGTAGNPALLFQASAHRAYWKMGQTPGGQPKHPDPVAVFNDCNYGGWWQGGGLWIGRYTAGDLVFRGVQDNGVSSVRVQPGYRVTFYDNADFTGASLVKTADDSCLVDDTWNDRVSSLVVEAVAPTATVYKDCNYLGRAVNLPVGTYTLAQLQVRGINNNDISSLRVAPGYQLIGYDGDNLTGTAITIGGDNSCLVQSSFNDLISSVRVQTGSATPTATARPRATATATVRPRGTATATARPRATATATPTTGGISTTAWYTIVNQTSGKCVDRRGNGTANGTVVQQYTCNNSIAQQWQFQTASGGYYRLNARSAPAQVMDVSGVSTADNALVHLWAWGGGTNQQWLPQAMGGGYYRFVAGHSGKCLDVPNSSTADSVQLVQYTCNSTGAQNFRLVQVP